MNSLQSQIPSSAVLLIGDNPPMANVLGAKNLSRF